MNNSATKTDFPQEQEPQNDAEVRFIRGLPYYSPRTAKQIAFCLDNGSTKEEVVRGIYGKDVVVDRMLDDFIDFYVREPERAKEMFMPYSWTDYSMSQY
jgi:hypothetical protein